MILKRYRLKDGSIYWHNLYFALVPDWMTKHGPPGGDYNYAAYLYQPHKYFIALYDHAKYFIQRGYRGYSDRDIWSLDYYLASWMPAALERLEQTKHGTPIGMTPKGWSTRIRTMREGFSAAHELAGIVPDIARSTQLLRKTRKGLKVFAECFFDLWD